MFINKFGNFYGLMSAMIGKYIMIVFPMIAYQYVDLKTTFLKNTYLALYFVIVIITIITTLRVDISNIMEIQYNI